MKLSILATSLLAGCAVTLPTPSPQKTAKTGWRPTASATIGFGPSSLRYKSAGLNASERAVSGRFKGEGFFGNAPVGPGLHASWTRTGDMFEGQTQSDGVTSQPATAKATHLDVYPHAAIRPVRSRHFDLIFRAGGLIDYLDLNHDAETLDTGFLSIGPKVAVEPEVFFINSRRSAFSWYASAGYAYAWSVVSENNAVRDENYSSTAQFMDLESGLRFRAGHFRGSLGYVYALGDVSQTDAKNSISLPKAETTRKMVMLEFGVDF